jgi:hypothetical protein
MTFKCSICSEAFNIDSNISSVTCCGKSFHEQCLSAHKLRFTGEKGSCPGCKSQIFTTKTLKNGFNRTETIRPNESSSCEEIRALKQENSNLRQENDLIKVELNTLRTLNDLLNSRYSKLEQENESNRKAFIQRPDQSNEIESLTNDLRKYKELAESNQSLLVEKDAQIVQLRAQLNQAGNKSKPNEHEPPKVNEKTHSFDLTKTNWFEAQKSLFNMNHSKKRLANVDTNIRFQQHESDSQESGDDGNDDRLSSSKVSTYIYLINFYGAFG